MPVTVPRLYVGGTVTPVAPVAAIPTTAAHLCLWNGEPTGGKTYTVTALSWTTIVSAGAAFVGQLLAHSTVALQPIVSGTVAKGPLSTDGLASASKALIVSAVTLTAGQLAGGMWHPVGGGNNGGAATATIAMGDYQLVRGIYILPPSGLLSLAVLCSAAASATCDIFVNWEEA
jgi:hypothetical protein